VFVPGYNGRWLYCVYTVKCLSIKGNNTLLSYTRSVYCYTIRLHWGWLWICEWRQ